MKTITTIVFILFVGILSFNLSFAQPNLEWSKNFGGSQIDKPKAMVSTIDGGLIIAGWSSSTDGDISKNIGSADGWIVKLDNNGNLKWEKSYGGTNGESFDIIKQTSDGGFIVAGESVSIDGHLEENNGEEDAWVLKLNNAGEVEWSRNYGGSLREFAEDVVETSDGGFAVLCSTESNDGDISDVSKGARDFWLLKLNSLGDIQWDKIYGGTEYDTPQSIAELSSGGFILAGRTSSTDGDVSDNKGSNDSWLIKLDNEGVIEWSNNYGGSDYDSTEELILTADGGYLLVGYSSSMDGDLGNNYGLRDGWALKLDSEGVIEWSNNYGGSDFDEIYSVAQTTDGGYILVGFSGSMDGDITDNNGFWDTWILKLDPSGNMEWSEGYGGFWFEIGRDIVQISESEFAILSDSESSDGDVLDNNGNSDFWVIQINIGNTTSAKNLNTQPSSTISPNPSDGQFTVYVEKTYKPVNIRIFDTMGHVVYAKSQVNESMTVEGLPKGNYFVQIMGDEFTSTKKLIVH